MMAMYFKVFNMDKISKHISYKEATKSYTATKFNIDNTPDSKTIKRMKKVANKIFEPLRTFYKVPIAVVSFYRSPKLNDKIGGSDSSQHVTGEAIDIDADVYRSITNKQIFDFILHSTRFDQLISEFPDDKGEPEWVHVSYDYNEDNRHEILVAYKEDGYTKYKYYEG